MIENILKLTVKYNSRIVGYLVLIDDNKIAFQYDDEWLKNGFSISPFSLPLTNKIFINNKTNFDGLYGVFVDSLPNGWGELLIQRMLLKKGISYDKLSPLQKLALISKNGLGGLTYEPSFPYDNELKSYELDKLAIEIDKVLNGNNNEHELDDVYAFGGSSGGARPKAHIVINNEEWIVKFPCHIDPVNIGVQEFMANEIAKECDINVNEFYLFPSKRCQGYFGVKRFDRKDTKRIHMISLSSLLETSHKIPNLDYNLLFQVIRNICHNQNDIYEAYKRMCFNVLFENRDDHGKNFSFLYDEELKSYKLSPAYDLTKTKDKIEHEMTINGNGKPTEKDLIDMAIQLKLSLSKCQEIIQKTKKIIKKSNIN